MESNLVSMAQQFSGLPMEDLIGGPLNAAAKANSAMAMTQTKFMIDTCFNLKKEGSEIQYSPIMIDMVLTRGVITPGTPGDPKATPAIPATTTAIQQVSTKFSLPLLTIMPLNSLAVETVDIGFEMEVKSSFSETENRNHESSKEGNASFETKFGWGPLSVSIKGSASYSSKDSETHNTHYEKSNSAKYTVNVHAGQLPLPKGVNTIIEAFAQSIQPITMPSVVTPA